MDRGGVALCGTQGQEPYGSIGAVLLSMCQEFHASLATEAKQTVLMSMTFCPTPQSGGSLIQVIAWWPNAYAGHWNVKPGAACAAK